MQNSTFKKRTFELVFKLAVRSQFKDAADEIRIKGLRMSANITMWPNDGAHAHIAIWGLSKDLINRLMTLKGDYVDGNQMAVNTVAITNIDKVPNLVFQGGITSATADFNSAPEVSLTIEANSTFRGQLTAFPAKTWNGVMPVATIMGDLAVAGRCNFVNLGVDSTLENESVNGSVMEMIRKVAQDANINWHLEGAGDADVGGGTLYIAPHGMNIKDDVYRQEGSYARGKELVISTANGMVGWPTPTIGGCEAVCIYSPEFRMYRKCLIKCPDIQLLDNSRQVIVKLQHNLQTEQEGGQWYSSLTLQRLGGDL